VSKKKKAYDALIEGATRGLDGDALYKHAQEASPKATSRTIVRSAFLALSDPDLKDRRALDAIYSLAISHRLDSASAEATLAEGDEADDAGVSTAAPTARKAARPAKAKQLASKRSPQIKPTIRH
jgi:hypothetical protein